MTSFVDYDSDYKRRPAICYWQVRIEARDQKVCGGTDAGHSLSCSRICKEDHQRPYYEKYRKRRDDRHKIRVKISVNLGCARLGNLVKEFKPKGRVDKYQGKFDFSAYPVLLLFQTSTNTRLLYLNQSVL